MSIPDDVFNHQAVHLPPTQPAQDAAWSSGVNDRWNAYPLGEMTASSVQNVMARVARHLRGNVTNQENPADAGSAP